MGAIPPLENLKRAHIVGVCGTLMGAFAAYLKRRGVFVSGSDENVYPPMSDVLGKAGVEISRGYRAENLTSLKEKPDLVVIGNVIRQDNPEARAAIDDGYAYSSLPEAMENLFLKKTRNLVVTGTHGKTTTSSLLSHVLSRVGRDPSYFIGGVAQDLPFSFHISNLEPGSFFVLEGDEYDTAFWDKVPKFNHYLPDDVILTSIEYDHADIYPDLAAVIQAFEGLLQRIRPGGRLICCTDYVPIRDLMKKTSFPVLTYGSDTSPGARFTPANIQHDGNRTKFEILDQGKKTDEISLSIPGHHNVLNAISAWILCRELGIDSAKLHEALSSFRGVKRRQEERGEPRGILVIDDFAHHPTAVRETLSALRMKYPGRRVIAVFEPRSATSRRKIFQTEYAQAFEQADHSFIASPYDQSRIPSEHRFSSLQLISDLEQRGKQATLFQEVEEGVAQVAKLARPGDLVAVLSNGGFGGFIPKLIEKLSS